MKSCQLCFETPEHPRLLLEIGHDPHYLALVLRVLLEPIVSGCRAHIKRRHVIFPSVTEIANATISWTACTHFSRISVLAHLGGGLRFSIDQ
jgi:hypothetical protein